ncbi:MAG TPA: hypothetical protein VLS27_20615 [Gammaproteobacteria bacterium]|nr:hypothetical protein [Gammaproteobacteria bacterium]
MSTAVAWIVPLPGNERVSVGALEFVHVLPEMPARSAIADGPVFMSEAISWEGGIIPVFDAGKFSQGIEKTSDTVYYGVVRYKPTASGPQQFGALKMTAIPQRVTIDDQMACDLPESHCHWRPFSISCFTLDRRPVPVLDLARLFSQSPVHSNIGAKAVTPESGPRNLSGRGHTDPSGYTDSLATT